MKKLLQKILDESSPAQLRAELKKGHRPFLQTLPDAKLVPDVHKSFLKWAGGKMQLLSKLREIGIEEGNLYIEPFVGSGVIALNMQHREIIIADVNDGLMNLWQGIQDGGEDFINLCESYFSCPHAATSERYYDVRDAFNNLSNRAKSGTNFVQGARFLYLNKHCFNGLCRFNKKGEFNVPHGTRVTPPSFPEKEIQHAFLVSERMTILKQGFEKTFAVVSKGDMVYCDPPYCPISETSSFTDYSAGGFNNEQHIKLVKCALEARAKGATVIISNNDTPFTRSLYFRAEKHYIEVQKKISCKGDGRKKLQEIIAVYRPSLVFLYPAQSA